MKDKRTGLNHIQSEDNYRYVRSTDRKTVARCSRRESRRCFGLSGLFVFIITLTVICGFIVTGDFQSLAQTENGAYGKLYKSITIEKGDTLWDIAEEYITDDYESIDEYVSVLMDMNNLKSDKILYGDQLIVAYSEI